MIDKVTFTGVDDQTDLDRLYELGLKYPKAEFGVLVGSQVGSGIFPTRSTVKGLRGQPQIQTAIHLCGSYSRAILNYVDSATSIMQLCSGFSRTQLNFPRRTNLRTIGVEKDVIYFAEQIKCNRLILQHRDDWYEVPIIHDSIEYLYDTSEGRGRESFDEWPIPNHELPRYGYAGGIGLHNIERVIEFDRTYPDHRFWFDMEGQIRTDGWYDLDIVEAICEKVFKE